MRQLSDTDPKMGARILERWRAVSPEERLERLRDLNRSVLALAAARQAQQYPTDTPEERRLRLGSLWLERDAMVRWFDWDPDEKGR